MKLDIKLKQMATDLQDTGLLARISGGDLVATEAKYHLSCLVQYKITYRSAQKSKYDQDESNDRLLQALVFAAIVPQTGAMWKVESKFSV